MVLPITGPVSSTQNVIPPVWPGTSAGGNIYSTATRYATWYRQMTPYDRPLAFDSWCSKVERPSPHYISEQAANASGGPNLRALTLDQLAREKAWALNKAYDRFVGEVGESASWLVTLAERKQTMSLLTNLLTRVYGFSSALRKYQWTKAVYTLAGENQQLVLKGKRVIAKGGLRKKSKDFSNNYLQFHFGLAPLYSDIYSTISILQSPIKDMPVKASSKVTFRYPSYASQYSGSTNVGKVYCRIGGNVQVSNPNLFLANQLGLVNPVNAAFDMIRFSFVLDWFVNVQDVLASWTDFAGLRFSGGYTTLGCACVNDWLLVGTPWGDLTGLTSHYETKRTLGIPPGPVLSIRKPWQLSARRGLAAASLLVQTLR